MNEFMGLNFHNGVSFQTTSGRTMLITSLYYMKKCACKKKSDQVINIAKKKKKKFEWNWSQEFMLIEL